MNEIKKLIDEILNISDEKALEIFVINYENTREWKQALTIATESNPDLASKIMSYAMYFNQIDNLYYEDKISKSELNIAYAIVRELCSVVSKAINNEVIRKYVLRDLSCL